MAGAAWRRSTQERALALHRPRTPDASRVHVLPPPSHTPPVDPEAEASVLGAILLDRAAIAKIVDVLEPDDFHRENNRCIYRAALVLHHAGSPIDAISLAVELEKLGLLDQVGGRAQLALLQESVPTASQVEYYARRVRRQAIKRRLADQAAEVLTAANSPAVDVEELAGQAAALHDSASRELIWTPPLPLVDGGALPEFPLVALPDWCAAFADALAEATQTPPDLAGMLILACLATCAAGRVRVEVRPGWEEPLNLFTLVALPPGERKTAVFDAATAPLADHERERGEELAPVITEAAIRSRALERAVEAAQTEAAKAKTEDAREAAIARAAELAAEAEAVAVPAPYRMLADDSTPEALATLLAEQGGRIAVLSDEGGVFGQMAGRYSTGRSANANLGVYLKGHAGSRLRIDRKGRPPEHVPRPALTIGVAVQPEVLRQIAELPEFRGLGILARFLYSLPTSRVGEREENPDPLSAHLADEYGTRLRVLARSLDAVRSAGVVIRFAPASQRLLGEYAAKLEPRLGERGDLRGMADWAGKLAGAIARMAALIHLGHQVRGAWGDDVPVAAVESAISIGDYALEHARAAFALMGADHQVELARRVLGWVRDRGLTEFSRRDAFYQLRNSQLPKVTDLDPVLALLVAHDYIAPLTVSAGRSGGRPSQRYRVNPFYGQNPQNPQNLGPDGGSVGFVGFAPRHDSDAAEDRGA